MENFDYEKLASMQMEVLSMKRIIQREVGDKDGDCCNNPKYAGIKQFDVCDECGHMKTPPVL